MIRLAGRGLGALALALGLLVVAALGLRAWLQHQTADTPASHARNGIDEARFVRIGGIDQWITIRGEDRRNPVVLVLHGGPGVPMSYQIRAFQPMERRYVVVQWDQRGGGKTFSHGGGPPDPNLSMATMVNDGIALSEYLRGYLHRDGLIIVGHSWGTVLGVKMAQARPDLYAAFVGTGQVAGSLTDRQRWFYAYLLKRAAAAGDTKGLAELKTGAGPPPWTEDSPQILHMAHAAVPYLPPHLVHERNVFTALTTPHWSLSDVRSVGRSQRDVLNSALGREAGSTDFSRLDGAFAIPVMIIQGENDEATPTVFARQWYGRVHAPAKAFVVIPAQGHSVLLTDNAGFTRALDANLRPLLAARRRADAQSNEGPR